MNLLKHTIYWQMFMKTLHYLCKISSSTLIYTHTHTCVFVVCFGLFGDQSDRIEYADRSVYLDKSLLTVWNSCIVLINVCIYIKLALKLFWKYTHSGNVKYNKMTTSFVKCAKHRHKFIAVQRLNHSSWKYSTASSSTDHQLNEIQPKPFRTIPGPSGPLGLGSIFNYFRFVGKLIYSNTFS